MTQSRSVRSLCRIESRWMKRMPWSRCFAYSCGRGGVKFDKERLVQVLQYQKQESNYECKRNFQGFANSQIVRYVPGSKEVLESFRIRWGILGLSRRNKGRTRAKSLNSKTRSRESHGAIPHFCSSRLQSPMSTNAFRIYSLSLWRGRQEQ